MDFKIAQAERHFIKKQRDLLFCLTVSLTIGLLMNGFGWFYALNHHQTLLIPPTANQAFFVSNQAVSTSYLEALATYFIHHRFNVTPANIQSAHQQILKNISQRTFDNIEQSLLKEQAFYRSEHINSDFKIKQIHASGKTLAATVLGELALSTGDHVFKRETLALFLQFAFIDGELKIIHFDKVRPT